MRLGRRAFLKLVAILSAFTYTLRPTRALAGESAVSIHRATRNTLLGSIGAGLREMWTPLPPFKTYAGKERVRLGAKPSTVAGPTLPEALERAYAGAEAKVAVVSASAAQLDGVPSASPASSQTSTAATAGATNPRTLTRDVLARLLYLTNGDTETNDGDPYKLRAAPSAGALYAGELYVVALSVADLERGVYYYDVGAHDLIRIRDEPNPPDFTDAFEDPTTATGTAALVLLTNVFERYETRYSNRGYRYALVDTGHIGENLRIAAAGAGIEHRTEPRFVDAQLNSLLEIDGNDEAVCAVHTLGRIASKDVSAAEAAEPRDAAAGGEASRRRFVEKAATGAHINDDSDPTVRYHEATALVVGVAKRSSRDSDESASADSQKASSAQVVTLANLEPAPATPAEGCIVSRRSPKGFTQQAISGAQLGFLTRAAYPAEAARRSIGLELQLVVHRVQGVESGLYRYVPSQQSLEVIRIDDYTDSLPRVCLGQAKAGDAAVGFLMVARIRAAAAEHGERAYRDLLIEAGEVGERIYLAAEALGLSARNLAAFIDEDLNSLLGLDGGDVAVVHMTMLGHGA